MGKRGRSKGFKRQKMQHLIVVPLCGGPLDGDEAEVPVGQREIWRHNSVMAVEGVYYRYVRGHEDMYVYAGESLTMEELADRMAKEGRDPFLHADSEIPTEKLQFFEEF